MKTFITTLIAIVLVSISVRTYSQGNITLQVAINDLRNSTGGLLIRVADENKKTVSE